MKEEDRAKEKGGLHLAGSDSKIVLQRRTRDYGKYEWGEGKGGENYSELKDA